MRGKIEFKKFQKEKKKIDYIIFQYQKYKDWYQYAIYERNS